MEPHTANEQFANNRPNEGIFYLKRGKRHVKRGKRHAVRRKEELSLSREDVIDRGRGEKQVVGKGRSTPTS